MLVRRVVQLLSPIQGENLHSRDKKFLTSFKADEPMLEANIVKDIKSSGLLIQGFEQ
jgi:hypothetical protein